VRQISKVLEVQERAWGTVPSLVGLGFHPPPGWPKTFSFYRHHCAQCNAPVFNLLGGRHVAPMGV